MQSWGVPSMVLNVTRVGGGGAGLVLNIKSVCDSSELLSERVFEVLEHIGTMDAAIQPGEQELRDLRRALIEGSRDDHLHFAAIAPPHQDMRPSTTMASAFRYLGRAWKNIGKFVVFCRKQATIAQCASVSSQRTSLLLCTVKLLFVRTEVGCTDGN